MASPAPPPEEARRPPDDASSLAARRREREKRRDRVIRVAGGLFAERGYRQASMDEISAAAGLSKPAVYSLFASKDELYVECLEAAGERFRASIASAAGGGKTPQERMWSAIRVLVEHIEADRDGWAMLLRDQTHAPAAIADEVVRLREQTTSLTGELFLQGARAAGVEEERLAAIEPISHMFVGMVKALAAWWLEHPDVPAEAIAAQLMNFAWMGLGDLIEGRLWSPPGGRV